MLRSLSLILNADESVLRSRNMTSSEKIVSTLEQMLVPMGQDRLSSLKNLKFQNVLEYQIFHF